MPTRGANCFTTHFNQNSAGHNIVNAYLLMVACRLIFPDQLRSSLTDKSDFEQKFTKRFAPLGLDKFDFEHGNPTQKYDTNYVVMSNSKVVIVAFRGTELASGWSKMIADFIRTDANILLKMVPEFGSGARVHSGFWNAFSAVRNRLITLVLNHRNASQRIWVTGHSLGGAQAVLAARTFKHHNIPVQGIYTYGCPRIGNDIFRSHFGISNTQRYVYALDLVPMVPDDIVLGFRHIGKTNNFQVPMLPGAGPYDSRLKLNDKERRGVGKVSNHNVRLYEAALFHHLSASQQGSVPKPALSS
jgi:hypothetical protein